MKTFRITMLFVLLGISCLAYSQEYTSPRNKSGWIVTLHEQMSAQQYEQAYATMVDSVDFDEVIPNEAMLDIADCLVALEKYDECISICNWYIAHHVNDAGFYPSLFDATYGECHYFKGNYKKAQEYLSAYITSADEAGMNPGLYYIGLYAHNLNHIHKYQEADILYERYLSQVMKEDDLTLEFIYKSSRKKTCGYRLYEYAYNKFFQGQEEEGAKLLQLAVKCGDEMAKQDYDVLFASSTFNKNVKYKNATIRDFDRIIEECDFPKDSLKSVQPISAGYFWYRLQQCNDEYKKLSKVIEQKKRPDTFERAMKSLNGNQGLIEDGLSQCNPYTITGIERELDSIMCGSKTFLKELRIYPAQQANAFATPYGEIYITDALIKQCHFNTDLLTGICAHEATHYLLQHSLIGLWKKEKREKRNKVWAGIASGLNAVAQVGATMYAASNGVSYDQEYYDNMASNITTLHNELMYSVQKDAYYFQFKYGRSQELESDLAAYRFCEAIGIGGFSYIMALQLLGDDDGNIKAVKDSDHPTMAFRIGLLKYLYNKEHKID